MSFDAHANFAYSLVAASPSPAISGTSLIVTTGDGSKFPTAPFNAVVWPVSSQPTSANAEIIRVTAVTGDALTITRAQESTSARTITIGDQIMAGITKKTLTDIEAGVNGLNSATTTVGVSAATAPSAGQALIATSSTAATWQNVTSTPQQPIHHDCSATTLWSQNNVAGSGALTFDGTNFALLTSSGTTSTSRVSAVMTRGYYVNYNAGDWNQTWEGRDATASSSTGQSYYGMGSCFPGSSHDFTQDHFGYKFLWTGSTFSDRYSTNGDGVGETATLLTLTNNAVYLLTVVKTSSSVKYYSGTTLLATHSSRISTATGLPLFVMSVTNGTGTSNIKIEMTNISYNRAVGA